MSDCAQDDEAWWGAREKAVARFVFVCLALWPVVGTLWPVVGALVSNRSVLETKISRILALDTSSRRGSVALLEGSSPADARICAYRCHDVENEHAERMLGMFSCALEDAGWSKHDVEKIAVGVGPGSFTGVRIGIALAQGLMLGLKIPGVGVGSLAALAAAVPSSDPRVRLVVRDARRDEFFVAAYGQSGEELLAPHTIAQHGVESSLRKLIDDEKIGVEVVVVGTLIAGFACLAEGETAEPDARAVGRLGMEAKGPVTPHYVRGPNIVRPVLPPSPLESLSRSRDDDRPSDAREI